MPPRQSQRFVPDFDDCIPMERVEDLVGCDVYVQGCVRFVPGLSSVPFEGQVHVADIQHHDGHELYLQLPDRTFVRLTEASRITGWVRSQKVMESVITFHDFQDLSPGEQELYAAALDGANSVYFPRVSDRKGAAVGLEGGLIISDVAKRSPHYVCAESGALDRVAKIGKFSDVRTIAVSGPSESLDDPDPRAPCGICRQRILECQEMAHGPITVLFSGGYGQVARVENVEALLPLARL